MRPRNGRIVIIQVCLVLLMSAVAGYCLFPIIGQWTILLFTGLLVIGASTIALPRIGVLPFSLLTFVASFPAILTHNIIDIGTFTSQTSPFYGSWSAPREMTFEISYWAVLGMGLFLISGYLILSYLNTMQKDYQVAVSGNADIPETKKVTSRNIVMVITLPVIAGLLAALLIVPLNAVQPAITEYMQDFPWSIIVFGLVSVLFLSGLIYRIGISKHKRIPEV